MAMDTLLFGRYFLENKTQGLKVSPYFQPCAKSKDRLNYRTDFCHLSSDICPLPMKNQGFYGHRKHLPVHQGFTDIDPIAFF